MLWACLRRVGTSIGALQSHESSMEGVGGGNKTTQGGMTGQMMGEAARRSASTLNGPLHPPPPPLHYENPRRPNWAAGGACRGTGGMGLQPAPSLLRGRGSLRSVDANRPFVEKNSGQKALVGGYARPPPSPCPQALPDVQAQRAPTYLDRTRSKRLAWACLCLKKCTLCVG